jgi:hypothetical protein
MRITIDEAIARFKHNAEYQRTHGDLQGCLEFRQLAEWLEELKQLREQIKWIPCSERMPEEREWIGTKKFGTTISDEVYVTLETISGKRFCDHIRFQNGKFGLSKQTELDAIDKGIKAIAWMPKPQPYVEEEE